VVSAWLGERSARESRRSAKRLHARDGPGSGKHGGHRPARRSGSAVLRRDQSRNKELLADLKDLAQTLLRRDKKSYDGLRFSGEIALIEKDLPRAIGSFEDANLAKPYQKDLVRALVQSLETAG
jgi:hypothetical protein